MGRVLPSRAATWSLVSQMGVCVSSGLSSVLSIAISPVVLLHGGFLSPGLAIDVDHVAVLDEAVDERRDAGRARKHRAPLSKRQVGRDDNRPRFVPPTDDVVEQVC